MAQTDIPLVKGKKSKKQPSPSAGPVESPSDVLTPTPASASANIDAIAPGGRQRGPVEEVIAKRMRQLGKKLQRYRAYAAQEPSTLNADQRAALTSLPFLEGAYRELEELTKEKGPVDEQELIQAAKLREARENAIKEAEAVTSTRIAEYQSQLLTPLGLFLRLYSLLHPARPSDHHHLTFAHLSLPASLQNEVQATDVLRVGRMYEELANGGPGGIAVLDQLVNGPGGDDEENIHIHHLLDLLSKSVAEDSSALPTDEPAESVVDVSAQPAEQPSEIVPPSLDISRAVSESELPNGHAEPTEEQDRTQPGLSFLQPDELEPEPTADEHVPEAIDESYEIVPQLEAHQTSGLQPPFQEKPYEAPVVAGSSAVQTLAIATPAFTATPGNWADLDDEDEEVFGLANVAAPPVLAPEIEATTAPATAEPEAIQAAPLPGKPAPAPKSEVVTEGSKKSDKPNGHRRGGRPEAQPRPKGPSTVVDEEGFVSKIRRHLPQVTRGRGGRSGGGAGGGGGGAGESRGRGNGAGRGRGGRNGAKASSNAASGHGQQHAHRPPKTEGALTGSKTTPPVAN